MTFSYIRSTFKAWMIKHQQALGLRLGTIDTYHSRISSPDRTGSVLLNLFARRQEFGTDWERILEEANRLLPDNGINAPLKSLVVSWVYPDEPSNGFPHLDGKSAKPSTAKPKESVTSSPKSWPNIFDKDQQILLRLVAQYIRWINKTIVDQLTAHNSPESEWYTHVESGFNKVKPKVPVDIYLWEGSSCVFPGVRRKTGGSDERASFKAKYCLCTDSTGNALAKQPWTWLIGHFDDKVSKSKGTRILGVRNGYHLVHVFPHKPEEVIAFVRETKAIYAIADIDLSEQERADLAAVRVPKRVKKGGLPGLFTSLANMCFAPGDLTRPTDAAGPLRRALMQQALHRFGVQMLPPWMKPIAEALLKEAKKRSSNPEAASDVKSALEWDTESYGSDPDKKLHSKRKKKFDDLLAKRLKKDKE